MPQLAHPASVRKTAGSEELRVALVGYGMAGREFHAPLMREVDGLRVSHVVTSNAERATPPGPRTRACRWSRPPTTLWPLADEVDLVVLASPTGVHCGAGGRGGHAGTRPSWSTSRSP